MTLLLFGLPNTYLMVENDQISFQTFFSPSDKPDQPTVTSAPLSPADGAAVTLTCASAAAGVTGYEFRHGDDTLVNSASPSYAISAAALGSHDGAWSCVVYVDAVASDESEPYILACEAEIYIST